MMFIFMHSFVRQKMNIKKKEMAVSRRKMISVLNETFSAIFRDNETCTKGFRYKWLFTAKISCIKNRLPVFATFGTTLFLVACSPVHVQPICPTLVPYNRAEQAALATELQAHPDLHETPRWISDYVGLRDQVRACGG